MGFLTAATLLAPVVGGLVGNALSAGDREAAAEAQRRALAEIERLNAGPDLARQIFLQEFKSAGVLTPEIEKAVDQGVSKVAQIEEDPTFKKAQMSALSDIMQVGRTGITAKERLQRELAREEAARAVSSAEGQKLAELRARGLAGSAAERTLLGRSADERARREYELSAQTAMAAEQRALQAMMQGGQFAGQVRGQEFDIARTKGGAEDEMQRFNISNRMGQEQRRVAMENQARQYNLAQQQQIMNMNIQQQNAELLRQRQAQQQMWQNQLSVAAAKSNALTGQAQQLQQQAGQTQQGWANIGQGVGQGLGAFASMQASAPLRNAQTSYYNTMAGLNPDGSNPFQVNYNAPTQQPTAPQFLPAANLNFIV